LKNQKGRQRCLSFYMCNCIIIIITSVNTSDIASVCTHFFKYA